MITYTEDLREQASYLLYRISKILKKYNFTNNSRLFLTIAQTLKLICVNASEPSKSYTYELGKLLAAFGDPDYTEVAVELWKEAYGMICYENYDFIVHYKIEKKLRKNLELYKSAKREFSAKYWVVDKNFVKNGEEVSSDMLSKKNILSKINKLKIINRVNKMSEYELGDFLTTKSEVVIESIQLLENYLDESDQIQNYYHQQKSLLRASTMINNKLKKSINTDLKTQFDDINLSTSKQSFRKFMKEIAKIENVRIFSKNEITITKTRKEGKYICWNNIFIYDGLIKQNQQSVKVFELNISENSLRKKILENIQWFLVYNP